MGVAARSRKGREALMAYAMLAPLLIVFGLFAYYPFVRLIDFALNQKFTNSDETEFVGFMGVWDVLSSNEFSDGLWITVKFMLYTVPAGLVIGVVLATLANRRLRGIKIFQTIFSSTIASSVAVASVVFTTLINRQVGYFKDVDFISLSSQGGALRGVALAAIWGNIGLTFVIVLAGMQAIPDEINEAATLDGYGPIRRFFKVTVPMISPTLLFLAVVLVVQALQAYAQIDILTNGGPAKSTETLLYKIAQLQGRTDLQTGASMALGLFLLTLVVSAGQYLMLNKRVHYDN
ncbi:MAG: sugar ABC transporter permease [Actinobacteria bacterium]|nr:sugar ABC transporter permease [Actinomycetota bacterium]